ncbi:MAG: type VI secretion system lipoprotein TssJ [Gammaproteobacteria bacterium]|nr:type VI secretion system lipoprotein TssJ [Gammaproteobacteria bacterium]
MTARIGRERRGRHRLWLIGLVVLLGGCASSGPTTISSAGDIVVASDVNPNPAGRPSPVVLHIYELRGKGAFNGADFFALYGAPAKTLGRDLVNDQEFEMQPGQSQTFNRKLPTGTRYIGVVAAFRDVNQAVWRSVAAVPQPKHGLTSDVDFLHHPKVAIHIKLQKLTVSVAVTQQ